MSGTRLSKRPPHIVFLVDTLPFVEATTLDESAIASLQALVVRILLYYVDAVDDRITWGFRFFNTNSTSITMSNRRFYPISTHSIHDFVKELRAKVDHERIKAATTAQGNGDQSIINKSNGTSDSCFSNLKETLMQTLTDFQWKDIDLLGASPRSQRVRNSTKTGGGHHRRHQPVVLNNYMYILSHRPHTLSGLHHYMEGHHVKKTIQTKLTSQGELIDAYDTMQKMADELKRWIWDGYATNQISINWIDKASSRAPKEMDTFIRTGFDAIMQMFGGHLIDESLLEYDYEHFGLSFGTLFNHYRNKLMDPVPELKLPMVRCQQGKKMVPHDDNNDNKKADSPDWSGHLISRVNRQDCFQIYARSLGRNSLSHPHHTTKPPANTLFDTVESMEIVSFISVDKIKLEWIETPGENIYILWSSGIGFSSLVHSLQDHQLVLIVKLCSSNESVTQLALVESIIGGCASLSLLSTKKEEDFITSYHLLLPEKNEDISLPPCPAPLGSNIIDFLKVSTSPSVLHDLDKTAATKGRPNVELMMDLPPCVDALIHGQSSKISLADRSEPRTNGDLPTEIKPVESSGDSSTNTMPDTIDEFTQALQDLYLDTLYTTKYTLLESMTVLLSYVNHISNLENPNKIEISIVLASLQSVTMLSSEFDEKHRTKIPAMMKTDTEQGSEQELICFSSWLSGVRSNYGRNTENEELSFKALKIKDAKLQMVFLLAAIQLIKQQKGDAKQEKASSAENPEEQLEIYFDRMFIWEQVSNVVSFLQEKDADAAEHSAKRLDPADIYIHQFCGNLDKCFKKTLPNLIGKLREKIDKDNDKDDLDDAFPTPNKRRKTLLEMRMRGDSSGETMAADWVTTPPRDNQESINSKHSIPLQRPLESGSSSAASKRKQSMFPILPFMKREIIMGRAVNAKAKQQQTVVESDHTSKPKPGNSGRPTFRRAGSFTKSIMSPKRSARRKTTTETTTVVMRKREHTSPTTPRTRMAREFGISMTPQATKSNSDNSRDTIDNISLINDLQSRFSNNMASVAKTPPRPRSTRNLGIAVSPARSVARKIIGHKSPRPQRTGSARDVLHHDHEHGSGDADVDGDGDADADGLSNTEGPRDLTNAFLAARSPTTDSFRANRDVRKTFSSLFDD
ncbi:hypothetical protein BCR42DRAFT_416627 [Absidia repens]|uniref:Treslin N-terminal domain-containing protein n=1 Tax=Absidia repens TaxID=90262 RepID=A0A1X2IER9_9FUNG|nr:hypothetical protein BCR42DRAFT_416627 [Absidia repens]